jgi:putative two-component system hydrogenase maturation factor HypX/HoxX
VSAADRRALARPSTSIRPSVWLSVDLSVRKRARLRGRSARARRVDLDKNLGIAYVHFEFYNGAMSTTQCQRLRAVLDRCNAKPEVKIIAMMGGYNYFSNGVHLNVIEDAEVCMRCAWPRPVRISRLNGARWMAAELRAGELEEHQRDR